ncbi:hypothetical protein niasHT_017892 [Heterodera trifolii]|uniref:Uncharacterized protein n=1 Tax=Heterodera trifolii TaxID=157864 RepID=A0ABD2LFF3_9BILA
MIDTEPQIKESEFDAFFVADEIKLSNSHRNSAIAAQLRTAKAGFQRTINLIDTMLGEWQHRKPKTVSVIKEIPQMRADDGPYHDHVNKFSPCYCKGASSIIQMGVNASHFGGIAMIDAICSKIDTKTAPISREECAKRGCHVQTYCWTMHFDEFHSIRRASEMRLLSAVTQKVGKLLEGMRAINMLKR